MTMEYELNRLHRALEISPANGFLNRLADEIHTTMDAKNSNKRNPDEFNEARIPFLF